MEPRKWISIWAALRWVLTRSEVISDKRDNIARGATPGEDNLFTEVDDLERLMVESKAISPIPISPAPPHSLAPIQQRLLAAYNGPWRSLAEKYDAYIQAFDKEDLGLQTGLSHYLTEHAVPDALDEIFQSIASRELQARGVWVDVQGVEHQNAPMPAEEAERLWSAPDPVDPVNRTWFTRNGTHGWRLITVDRARLFKLSPKSEKPPARRGRPPAYDWDSCRQAVMNKLNDDGAPDRDDSDPNWQCQANLEEWILDWMIKRHGNAPEESTIRGYASRWLTEFREQCTAGQRGQ